MTQILGTDGFILKPPRIYTFQSTLNPKKVITDDRDVLLWGTADLAYKGIRSPMPALVMKAANRFEFPNLNEYNYELASVEYMGEVELTVNQRDGEDGIITVECDDPKKPGKKLQEMLFRASVIRNGELPEDEAKMVIAKAIGCLVEDITPELSVEMQNVRAILESYGIDVVDSTDQIPRGKKYMGSLDLDRLYNGDIKMDGLPLQAQDLEAIDGIYACVGRSQVPVFQV